MIITIDGPVASGKSVVAKLLAEKLGTYFLSSGMWYRAIAYLLVTEFEYDTAKLRNPAQADVAQIALSGDLEYRYANDRVSIFWKGVDITSHLKTAQVDAWTSISSAQPVVRHAIFELQVALGKSHDLVAEGRDMGSVVFSNAEHKFFLTAPLQVRARRWMVDQEKQGNAVSFDAALAAVGERDRRDSTREHSPLVQPQDARVIDNASLTIDETVNLLVGLVRGSQS